MARERHRENEERVFRDEDEATVVGTDARCRTKRRAASTLTPEGEAALVGMPAMASRSTSTPRGRLPHPAAAGSGIGCG